MKIILLDTNINYAKKLLWYLSNETGAYLKVVFYTHIDKFISDEAEKQNLKRDIEYSKNILLLSESILEEFTKSEYKKYINMLIENFHIVVLTNSEYIDEAVINKTKLKINLNIFKFQSAIKIRSMLLEYISGIYNSNIVKRFQNIKVLGIFSPLGRSGKTSLSLALALASSESNKTLLISFEEYKLPWLSEEISETYLSELIYIYKSNKLSYEKLNKEMYSRNNLSIISGLGGVEDIEELGVADIKNIIEALIQYNIFEVIIIDFAALAKRSIKLFCLCNIIYLPRLNDDFSRNKLEEVRQVLDDREAADIREVDLEKILDFNLSKNNNLNLNYLRTSKLYNLAKDLVAEEVHN